MAMVDPGGTLRSPATVASAGSPADSGSSTRSLQLAIPLRRARDIAARASPRCIALQSLELLSPPPLDVAQVDVAPRVDPHAVHPVQLAGLLPPALAHREGPEGHDAAPGREAQQHLVLGRDPHHEARQ